MQAIVAKMLHRDPTRRIDAATLWHAMQEDITNHGTMNPADPDSPMAINPTVVLGATVVGVESPSTQPPGPTPFVDQTTHRRSGSISSVRLLCIHMCHAPRILAVSLQSCSPHYDERYE